MVEVSTVTVSRDTLKGILNNLQLAKEKWGTGQQHLKQLRKESLDRHDILYKQGIIAYDTWKSECEAWLQEVVTKTREVKPTFLPYTYTKCIDATRDRMHYESLYDVEEKPPSIPEVLHELEELSESLDSDFSTRKSNDDFMRYDHNTYAERGNIPTRLINDLLMDMKPRKIYKNRYEPVDFPKQRILEAVTDLVKFSGSEYQISVEIAKEGTAQYKSARGDFTDEK